MEKKVLWIDSETTGLDPIKNGMVQLAALVEIDDNVVERTLFKMNPLDKEFDPEAMRIHGIPLEEIQSYPAALDVKQKITNLFDKYIDKYDKNDKFTVAGFNVAFDMKFLERLWVDSGDKYLYSYLHRQPIDPFASLPFLEWAGVINPSYTSRSLERIATFLGFSYDAHDALEDIEMTRKVAIEFKRRMAK